MAALASRSSSEDLMRAFDVLTRAEFDIRASAQPRYHLEMALLRWLHLRRLVPLSDLIQGVEKGAPAPRPSPATAAPRTTPAPPVAPKAPAPQRSVAPSSGASPAAPPAARPAARPEPAASPSGDLQPVAPAQLKDAFLEEVRRTKKFFHGTVVAMAQKIEVDGDRIVFTFGPHHRALRGQLDQTRPWLEDVASRLAGRRMAITSAEGAPTVVRDGSPRPAAPVDERKDALKQQALEDSGVQAMLDVFAAEIKDVEER
jgi:DNA polymerase-3 subunit gamma/tau